jgi:hypothetical protein
MIDTYFVVKQYNAGEKYLGYDRTMGHAWVNSFNEATTFPNETKEEVLSRLDDIFRCSDIFDNVYFELIEINYVPKDNHSNQYDPDDLPF